MVALNKTIFDEYEDFRTNQLHANVAHALYFCMMCTMWELHELAHIFETVEKGVKTPPMGRDPTHG